MATKNDEINMAAYEKAEERWAFFNMLRIVGLSFTLAGVAWIFAWFLNTYFPI